MVLILSGEKGCGKTSLVKRLLEEYSLQAQGFLSLKDYGNGEPRGISLLVLPQKKPFPVATTSPIATQEKTSRFYFYPRVFDLVNRHFHRIIPDMPFVFDEFGSLEMEGKGYFPIFALLKKISQTTLMIVKGPLLERFISSHCRDMNYSVININDTPQRYAAQGILDFFIGQQHKGIAAGS